MIKEESSELKQYEGLSDKAFKKLSEYIEAQLGIRMPAAKRIMLESRLQKRLRILGLPDYDAYLDYVFSDRDDTELVQMIDAVTTNKTDFFREPDHFDILTQRLLPKAMADMGSGKPFSFWSAGCATGEEPYTLAMVLEEFTLGHPGFSYRIVASDISTQALQKAVDAIYASERVEVVPLSMKKKYLLRSKDSKKDVVRFKQELREKIKFIRLNFMDESYPFDGVFDVVFCRNVIIYFDRATQEKMLGRICKHLRSGGNLILGHSETLTGMNLPLRSVAPTVYEKT